MKRVELAINIAASPSDIWTVLTNLTAFPDWITGMQSVELLTAETYGVGTRYHVIAGMGERTVEWTVEITGLELERRIDFSYGGDVEGQGGWLIEAHEDGVHYRVTSFDEFAPPGGWLVKLLSKFWPDNASRAARQESLERLKEMLEREHDEVEDRDQALEITKDCIKSLEIKGNKRMAQEINKRLREGTYDDLPEDLLKSKIDNIKKIKR